MNAIRRRSFSLFCCLFYLAISLIVVLHSHSHKHDFTSSHEESCVVCSHNKHFSSSLVSTACLVATLLVIYFAIVSFNQAIATSENHLNYLVRAPPIAQ